MRLYTQTCHRFRAVNSTRTVCACVYKRIHTYTYTYKHKRKYSHSHTKVSCCELYQNQVYDLLMDTQHEEVILGSKDDLPLTFHLFSKVDVNCIDDFWAVLSRIERVQKKKTINLKAW